MALQFGEGIERLLGLLIFKGKFKLDEERIGLDSKAKYHNFIESVKEHSNSIITLF